MWPLVFGYGTQVFHTHIHQRKNTFWRRFIPYCLHDSYQGWSFCVCAQPIRGDVTLEIRSFERWYHVSKLLFGLLNSFYWPLWEWCYRDQSICLLHVHPSVHLSSCIHVGSLEITSQGTVFVKYCGYMRIGDYPCFFPFDTMLAELSQWKRQRYWWHGA